MNWVLYLKSWQVEARLSFTGREIPLLQKDYDMWSNMVRSLLQHLMGRYGEEEVIQWPLKYGTSPIFAASGKNADMQEYFKLFHRTFDAIKEVNRDSV